MILTKSLVAVGIGIFICSCSQRQDCNFSPFDSYKVSYSQFYNGQLIPDFTEEYDGNELHLEYSSWDRGGQQYSLSLSGGVVLFNNYKTHQSVRTPGDSILFLFEGTKNEAVYGFDSLSLRDKYIIEYYSNKHFNKEVYENRSGGALASRYYMKSGERIPDAEFFLSGCQEIYE